MSTRIVAWETDTYPEWATGSRTERGEPIAHHHLVDPSQDSGYYWQSEPHRQIVVELATDARVGQFNDAWNYDAWYSDGNGPCIWADARDDDGAVSPRSRNAYDLDQALECGVARIVTAGELAAGAVAR